MQLKIKDMKERYFIDVRSGCAAVRDRLHPNYDPDYPGLHIDTPDVVEYRHGYQDHDNNCWSMKDKDLDYLRQRCIALNDARRCCFCGDQTDVVFNIRMTAKPVCESCASSIFLQQAKWYTEQNNTPN